MFRELERSLAKDGVALRVVYSAPNSKEETRQDNLTIQDHCFRLVRSRWLIYDKALVQNLFHDVRGADFLVIEHASKYLSNYPLLLAGMLGAKRVAFWGHGHNLQSRRRTMSEVLKAWTLHFVDWYFGYTEGTCNYLIKRGFPASRLTVLHNATDTEALTQAVSSVSEAELQEIRDRFGIKSSDVVAMAIGSLHADKQIPLLIDAVRHIRARAPKFHLILVGGGVEVEQVLRAAKENPEFIHYAGPIFGDARAPYLKLASLCLNPGLVGLAILDAFAAGLPVVTTDYPHHSSEIEYLEPERNGLVTRLDVLAFSDAVVELLNDPARLELLSEGALVTAGRFTLRAMVERFHDGILAWLRTNGAAPTARERLVRPVFLTNILPVYRAADLAKFAAHYPELQIFLSQPTVDENLAGSTRADALKIQYMRSLRFQRWRRHPDGFRQATTVFVPYDVLPMLHRARPDVIIATELGLRTLQAVIYKWFAKKARLIVHADLSVHTERGYGGARRILRSLILRNADAVVVNGGGGERYVREFGFPDQRIYRIPYSAAAEKFPLASRSRSDCNQVRLIYVGQFIERKGLVPFLESLSAWCGHHGERAIRMTLVGEGELKARIESITVPSNLELVILPKTEHERLRDVYGSADIFVLPTLADTWGIVVNEAMLTGLPVLGSAYSQAVSEMVLEGITGWTFFPRNPESMMAAIDRALSTPPEQIQAMGVNAREVAEFFSPERVGVLLQKCTDSVLDLPRRVSGSEG